MASTIDFSALLLRHARPEGLTQTPIPGLAILRRDAPCRPVDGVYRPLLCIVVQGSKRVGFGGGSIDIGAGEMIITAAEMPVSGQVVTASRARPFGAVSIEFDLAVVAELAAPLEPASGPPLGVAPPRRWSSRPAVLDAVTRLCALLDTPEHIPVLAPLLKREITYRLLTGPEGAALGTLAPGGPRAGSIRVVAAWLKDHPVEDTSVAELARMANMSVATFHRNFRAVTSLTPLQFQKRLRLHQARRLMMTAAADAASAAHKVGYESASQFAREYRRLFGAPPGRDIAEAIATIRQDHATI